MRDTAVDIGRTLAATTIAKAADMMLVGKNIDQHHPSSATFRL
jgi:hypothetical protein